MNLVNTVRTVPRVAVSAWIDAARLPLLALELVVRRGAPRSEWPPVIAFERAEAAVKQVAGSLLRDEQLVRQGRLLQAKVTKLRDAEQLEAMAEVERQEAQSELEAKRQNAEQQRQRAKQDAEKVESRLEQKRQERQREVERQAAKRKQAARTSAAKAEKSIDKTERSAKLAALDAETEALEAEKQALARENAANTLDDAIEKSKRQRKTS